MPTPKQEITVKLDGTNNVLRPESVASVIENLVELLKSIDAQMWRVGKPRYRWRISRASMSSPFSITFEAMLAVPNGPDADVVGSLRIGLQELDTDNPQKRPKYFSDSDLERAKKIVSVYRDGIGNIILDLPQQRRISPTLRIAHSADSLIRRAATTPSESYGSVEGILRRVTVDDREDHEKSEIQIIDRLTEQLVECKLGATTAEELATHIRKRVILFGRVRYASPGIPTHIDVESYRTINDSDIPSLEEIQNLNLNITNNKDPAEFIEDLRDSEG